MGKKHLSPETLLRTNVYSQLAKRGGKWTSTAERKVLKKTLANFPSQDLSYLKGIIRDCLETFNGEPACALFCAGKSCRNDRTFSVDEARKTLGPQGVMVCATSCQDVCKKSPSVFIKQGKRTKLVFGVKKEKHLFDLFSVTAKKK